MQSQDFFPTSARTKTRHVPLIPLLLLASVWSQCALAAWWLCENLAATEAVPYRATAAAILILLSAVQARLAWQTWRKRKTQPPVSGSRWRIFFRWLSVGFVVCYGGSLLAGAQQGGIYLFTAAMALWFTAVLLPLVGTPAQLSRVVALLGRRWLRMCGWGAYALLMTPLCSELLLRTYAEFFSGPEGASYLVAQRKLPPGSSYGDRRINAQGYWDDDFSAEPRPGMFRVAVLGGDVVLGDKSQEHFLTRVESMAGDLEVYNFALPRTVPADYAGQVQREVAKYHPQLVLAFISLGEDLTEETPHTAFDWQRLHTFRFGLNLLLQERTDGFLTAGSTIALSGAMLSHGTATASEMLAVNNTLAVKAETGIAPASDPYQAYLERTTGKLALCRTPIDKRMHAQWNRLNADLERLIATCEKADLPLALVLTPSEYQVNSVLREVLRRRSGLAAEDLDWELPQRRIATFAQQHQVPLVDLTPHLQLANGAFARYDQKLSASGHAVAAEVIGHYVRTRLNTTLAVAK